MRTRRLSLDKTPLAAALLQAYRRLLQLTLPCHAMPSDGLTPEAGKTLASLEKHCGLTTTALVARSLARQDPPQPSLACPSACLSACLPCHGWPRSQFHMDHSCHVCLLAVGLG